MKIFGVLVVIFLIAMGVGGYFWWDNGLKAVDTSDKENRTFVIEKGEGTRAIVDDLKEKGLIRDTNVFLLLMKKMGVEGLQAGVFYVNPAMSAKEIIKELQTGKFDIVVTIPEGKRAKEIADIFEEKMPQYSDDWRGELDKYEGYLFPDTYYFNADSEIGDIISIMTNNFDNKFAEVENNTNLSNVEIVILASLIEREALHDEDRALISSVIHNRLDLGMKLDIDATVQYALGYDEADKRWWKKRLLFKDLEIESPYNTYRNPGLPPGPISNPGLASLVAAGNPEETDYLFYIADHDGINHYAKTLEEHNENIEKYR